MINKMEVQGDKIVFNENQYGYKTYIQDDKIAEILSTPNITRLLNDDDYKAIEDKLLWREDLDSNKK